MRKYIVTLCIVIIAVFSVLSWNYLARPKISWLGGAITSTINKVIHDESLPYEHGVFYTQSIDYKVWNNKKKIAITSCVYSENHKFHITNPVISKRGQNLLGFSDSQYKWTAQIQSKNKEPSNSALIIKLLYDLSEDTVTLKNTGEVLPFKDNFTYVVCLEGIQNIKSFSMLSEPDEHVPMEINYGVSEAKLNRKKHVEQDAAGNPLPAV